MYTWKTAGQSHVMPCCSFLAFLTILPLLLHSILNHSGVRIESSFSAFYPRIFCNTEHIT